MPVLLNTPIESVARIDRRILPALKRLGIRTLRDLLFHFPARYDDFSNEKDIAGVFPGETVSVQGAIEKISVHRTFKKRLALTEAVIRDETGKIKAVWFNQPFLARNLKEGFFVRFSGKVAKGPGGAYLQSPSYERVGGNARAIHTGGLVAVYPETRGITSRWFRYLVSNFIRASKNLVDPIPPDILKRNNLPRLSEALSRIHFPKTREEAQRAERRFIFEDLFLIQLRALRERNRLKEKRAPEIPLDVPLIKKFVRSLPFSLTDAQRRSLWEIGNDLVKPSPMNRLLEGDVGSGKTVVAAAAALLAVRAGYRAVFMAPTEILARQHFATLEKLLKPFSVSLGFRTGAEKRFFDADVVVGTHALIQKHISFENLGLVVVDEQHRFGVNQRQALTRSQTTNSSESTNEKIVEKELSYKLGGIFFKIQEDLGRFCRERQYGDELEKKLVEAQIDFKREYPIEVGGRKSNFVDFIVENRILVDLKAKPFVEKSDYYQMKRYLEIANIRLGLIVNFQDKYLKPKRILGMKKFVDSNIFVASNRYVPHFLSMSATPIPRTLALSIYGDLDLSILDEMPKSRKSIATEIVEPGKREATYQFIHGEVKKGRQVFVICPRIETPSTNNESVANIRMSELQKRMWEVKAVKDEYKKLSERVFPNLSVAMLHGKMPAKTRQRRDLGGSALGGKSKEEVMKDFRDGKIDILVSTSVVEVGVDIPNASVMMIEGAERFGLAQLHQFRGRVGRGAEQSYCFLFPTEEGAASRRLRAVRDAKSGFELAQKDLEIRGPGNMFGIEQSGFSQHALKGITDAELVRAVRREAIELLKTDPGLRNHSALAQKLTEMEEEVHWE